MNTPFGKILEKNIFKKVFSAVILLSSVVGAVMNSYAVWTLGVSTGVSCIIGIIYIVMGISALMQNQIMEKWRNKKLEMLMGIYSCFFIYDFMILLLWWIFSALFMVSGKAQAMGVFVLDILAVIIVALGYLHAKKIKYTVYSIPLGVRGNTCRIAMMSDIHLGVFVGEKHIQNIVDKVNRLETDLVVIC